ncbi:hypothetical protein SU69_05660 [Thermosipho melanesiensis]|uniref:DUF488 domain-containing protein n=2 Tax=Thermosipho melanesiensis TaxID=46541 RepID=A6LM13_THEM4|nr:DUF488 domain-containing protein [Thermosipho melanesiensis]ABR30964.1 protein of unknown function DUF1130 [Thermosipho melanesiensis BI429]APT74065.1 hypothetical protein BW47_05940 [Thermosipho melanesiensis]OOC36009.1 hypothetical protein SU68_05720 [Thermosipho melanesiensis]OOC38148.1 hypothetical protein SU69_05660 [Thermosipho melanesiensis]OOC38277.1 hypothetical protein SU70_05670 [Thermosipho melanesiensis]
MEKCRKQLPKFYRQKFLLVLLEVFGKELKKMDFQKYLFLYQQLYRSNNPLYYFVPYKYGPFSFQAYADLHKMENQGFLIVEDTIKLTTKITNYEFLKKEDKKAIEDFYLKFKNLHGRALLQYVYEKYPYYASKSEIRGKITSKEYMQIENTNTEKSLFTLGYEGITIEQYLNMLIKNNIHSVIDVRKNPISMKYGFSRKTLKNALENLNIEYIHLPELGIDSNKRKDLSTLEDYNVLFEYYKKNVLLKQKSAIERILKEYSKKNRVVLTCFEKDPKYCHRSKISDYIENHFGIKVIHL